MKDAYYSIPIKEEDRKYFKFYFDNKPYEFCALPQGYRESPRLFTKILKPPLAVLRSYGFINSAYLDDIFMQANTFEDCEKNVLETITLLDKLGFTINVEKSIITPCKQLEFLGFIIDSERFIVYPTIKNLTKLNYCAVMSSNLLP